MFAVMLIYAAAAVDQRRHSGHRRALSEPARPNRRSSIGDFSHCFKVLWSDKLAQIALWVTTLLWGAAVTLQLLVLKWADANLGLSLSKAAVLQGVTGIGIAIGAAAAAALIPLRQSLKVLPVGVRDRRGRGRDGVLQQGPVPGGRGRAYRAARSRRPTSCSAYPLMILLGALSGFFIVPMNAILQHRGATLLSAGHSIAVQNFNQNLAVLAMLGAYALLLTAKVPVQWIIVVFGSFITFMMWLAKRRSAVNERTVDMRALVEE